MELGKPAPHSLLLFMMSIRLEAMCSFDMQNTASSRDRKNVALMRRKSALPCRLLIQ